jgi:hypothetical protein
MSHISTKVNHQPHRTVFETISPIAFYCNRYEWIKPLNSLMSVHHLCAISSLFHSVMVTRTGHLWLQELESCGTLRRFERNDEPLSSCCPFMNLAAQIIKRAAQKIIKLLPKTMNLAARIWGSHFFLFAGIVYL